MSEFVGHQLRNGAHGHLTESSTETCDAQARRKVRGGSGRSGDDEADATDCVSNDENKTASEKITVGAGQDEADGVGSRVSRNCLCQLWRFCERLVTNQTRRRIEALQTVLQEWPASQMS